MTAIPLTPLTPTPTIDTAGPAAAVVFTLDGLWVAPSVLTVAITVAGGTNISTTIDFSTSTLGPVEAAQFVADTIVGLSNGEISASLADNVVTLTAEEPATALTITTLSVA